MNGPSKRCAMVRAASLFLLTAPPARPSDGTPPAAELVRQVRRSEDWLHDVNSFYVCVESTWTDTPEAIAVRRGRLQEQHPDEKPAGPIGA